MKSCGKEKYQEFCVYHFCGDFKQTKDIFFGVDCRKLARASRFPSQSNLSCLLEEMEELSGKARKMFEREMNRR